MDADANQQARKRRGIWPTVIVGTGIAGAATLTLVLLSPFGSSPAAAAELTAFDDCASLQEHMTGLALDRIYDRGRGGLYSGDDREMRLGGVERGGPFAVPDAPVAGRASGDTAGAGADPGFSADAGTAAAPGAATAEVPAAAADPGAAPAPAPVADATRTDAGSTTTTSGKSSSGESAPLAPASTGAKDSARDAVGNAASGTNTQEAGVDEADLAKTDGKLLVTVIDGRLVVMDVSGKSPRARGSVDLAGQTAQELLLSGDRALVVGTPTEFTKFRGNLGDVQGAATEHGSRQVTTISLVDLSDPDRPRVASSEEITARYLSARMTGDAIRVVFSSTPDVLRSFDYSEFSRGESFAPNYDRDGAEDPYLADARERLARIPAQDWLPQRRIIDRQNREVSEAPLLACEDVRYPVTDSGMDLISVLTIDAGNDDPLGLSKATAVIGSGDLVYASADRLYVATTDGGWNDAFASRRDGRTGVTTRVHSFDISDGPAEYLATGRVPGYLYGRWAMSEHEGLLRMVTTANPPWDRGGSTQTGVVILDTADKRMREIGRVDGMGFTETVRSVRWFDGMAAIVTFRQTDPLYLVDVSKPESPRVRGELKIPGYSAYLHPVGDHRLLGVGQDADRSGQPKGLQLSSFDVLDLSDPRRTDALFLGNHTSSPVETDPRGFVYLPEDRLAVLPVFVPGYACERSNLIADGPRRSAAEDCEARSQVPAGLAFAEDERGNSTTGLVAIGVADNGDLKLKASWGGTDGRDVIKVMPLPDGRLVALNEGGVTLLEADSLKEFGFARYR